MFDKFTPKSVDWNKLDLNHFTLLHQDNQQKAYHARFQQELLILKGSTNKISIASRVINVAKFEHWFEIAIENAKKVTKIS